MSSQLESWKGLVGKGVMGVVKTLKCAVVDICRLYTCILLRYEMQVTLRLTVIQSVRLVADFLFMDEGDR
jgi:hypothetical protein